jgi:hypothetical protein
VADLALRIIRYVFIAVRLANAERILAVSLVAYFVCDILLTPPAHIETRDPSRVTTLGIATLALLFIGLAFGVIAFILLFRGSRLSPMAAIVAGLLYFPAPLAELTGHFSSLRPPTAIAWIELAQTVVAVIVIAVGFWIRNLGKRPASSHR